MRATIANMLKWISPAIAMGLTGFMFSDKYRWLIMLAPTVMIPLFAVSLGWDASYAGKWHRWFAWHPIRMESWIWLKWVERFTDFECKPCYRWPEQKLSIRSTIIGGKTWKQ